MRIWVARAEPAASRTAERLRGLGYDALVAPVSTVGPTDEPVPPGPFDGVLLTSANAADRLSRAVPAQTRIFAVGRRTAAAARSAGFADVLTADGDAVSLADVVGTVVPPGAALLHVAGADRKAEPGATLERMGYRLAVWTAYAALAADALPPAVRAALAGEDAAPLEAALHYSRRSAALALTLARAAGLAGAFAGLRHACLSADVAVPLVEAGIAAHFVPARPDEDSLLAGLAELG